MWVGGGGVVSQLFEDGRVTSDSLFVWCRVKCGGGAWVRIQFFLLVIIF